MRTAPARRRGRLVAVALVLSVAPAAPALASASSDVHVVSSPLGSTEAARAVRAAGGTVVDALPLSGSVTAHLVPGRTPEGVRVTGDLPLHVTGTEAGSTAAGTVRASLGLAAAGTEGAGVGVAIVDTGVADVPGLAGRVTHVNVSDAAPGDGYGHGTFMAGLVAGAAPVGVAPGAHVLDVQVADADGETSLVRVLRGLEAVAARADTMSIRVVNLSLSSGSPLPPAVDPLAQAVETLWAQGLTVVVAAGNDGPDAGSVSSPGNDPVVLTVGALDDAGTTAHDDDSVASWSSRDRGAAAKPELLAPGAAVVSLRAPGSVIDAANPGARVGSDGFRGSGTSMSAAVTSGAVAALLAARPQLTPDDVKALVSATAYDVAGSTGRKAAGGLDLTAALGASVPRHHGSRPDAADLDEADAEAWFALARAWAAGDYDAAARAWALMSPQARAWAARAWAARAWAARAWAGRAWADEEWAGGAPDDGWLARAWAARAWTARAWAARAWSGRAWADEEFAGRAWAARAWSARAWSARAWSARAWSARAWSGRAWADEDWAGRAWAAEDWAARAWSARAWSARAWSARAWG